jgi:hypothetical protein
MRERVTSQVAVLLLLTAVLGITLRAQITLQPTPPPTVTAENESWYLSGAPITWNGNLYYPAGPITHFVRNEMVRAGTYGNVPIYIQTTREPGSIIYVPLAGGLVRPYERRRAGDLAGTVGSTAPSFVVTLPAEETASGVLRAPAPPTGVPVGTTGFIPTEPEPEPPAPAPVPVGTAGPTTAPVHTRIQTVKPPVGLNAVFIDFQGRRWFSAGPAVEFSADRFTQIGEYRGFPVYVRQGQPDVIYIPLLRGAPGLVAPYKLR